MILVNGKQMMEDFTNHSSANLLNEKIRHLRIRREWHAKNKEKRNRKAREKRKRKRQDELDELAKLTDEELLIRSSPRILKVIEKELNKINPSIMESFAIDEVLSLLHKQNLDPACATLDRSTIEIQSYLLSMLFLILVIISFKGASPTTRERSQLLSSIQDHKHNECHPIDAVSTNSDESKECPSLLTQPDQPGICPLVHFRSRVQQEGTDLFTSIPRNITIIPKTIVFDETFNCNEIESGVTDYFRHGVALGSHNHNVENNANRAIKVKRSGPRGSVEKIKGTRNPTTILKQMVTRASASKLKETPTVVPKAPPVIPPLNSFLIHDRTSTVSLMRNLRDHIEETMQPFEKYFHPIIPSTNDCRMNYQSRQAIRIFYGKNCTNTSHTQDQVSRFAYGPLSVLNSTGAHPSKHYKVYPFTEYLDKASRELSQLMKSRDAPVDDFNFVEIKVYLGNDIFKKKTGGVITDVRGKPLRLGCNKAVNSHNDLRFSDEGVQSKKDTARGDQPTLTVTVGSSRSLTFERLHKIEGETKWSKLGKELDESFNLPHGSIFVLSPEDDKPAKVCSQPGKPGHLYKTKHSVMFRENGVSFAFVFRCVRKTSKFDPISNLWLWKCEPYPNQTSVEKFLQSVRKRHFIDTTYTRIAEQQHLRVNMKAFFEKFWRQQNAKNRVPLGTRSIRPLGTRSKEDDDNPGRS